MDSAFSQETRLVHLEERGATRPEHAAALLHERAIVGGVLHHAVREYVVERVVRKRQVLAVRDSQAHRQVLLHRVARREADGGLRDIHAHGLGPGSREAYEVDARAAAHIEHTAAPLPVEVHEPEQVMELLEVILIEIRVEARGTRGMGRDGEVVDVGVPVRADSARVSAFGGNRGHGPLL